MAAHSLGSCFFSLEVQKYSKSHHVNYFVSKIDEWYESNNGGTQRVKFAKRKEKIMIAC
jgi:hypothetical protein